MNQNKSNESRDRLKIERMTHAIVVKSNLNVQIIDTRENVCFLIKLLVVCFDQRTGAPHAVSWSKSIF